MKPLPLRRLDPADSRPFYRQVAAILREAIADQTYRAGERIPSVRDLATHFDIAALTVGNAIKELTNEGLVASRKGFGSYVLTNRVGTNATGAVVPPLERKVRRLLLHIERLPRTSLDGLPAILAQIAEVASEIEDDLRPASNAQP